MLLQGRNAKLSKMFKSSQGKHKFYGTNNSGLVFHSKLSSFLRVDGLIKMYLFILIGFLIVPDTGFALVLDPLLHLLSPSPTTESHIYTSWEEAVYCNPSSPILTPTTVEEVQGIVQMAVKSGKTVKALGSRHSVSDVICTDGIPISMKGIVFIKDNQDGTVTFGAGIEVEEAMKYLQSQGKSLVQVLTYGGVTIGGALGTGAHGSTLRHPTAISDQVVGVTVVDGRGNLLTITDPEELKIFRVHLGLLGIVVDVTLRTVPLYKMTVENVPHSDAILFDGTALSWASQYDFFQIFWFPSMGEVVVTKGNYTSVSVPGSAVTNYIPELNPLLKTTFSTVLELLHSTRAYPGLLQIQKYIKDALHSKVVGKPPIFSEDGIYLLNPATGYGWSLQANKCGRGCAWVAEEGLLLGGTIIPDEVTIAIDISSLTSALTMVKDVLTKFPATFELSGIYLRFLKPSDALMSISRDRTTVIFEYPMANRQDRFNTARAGMAAYQAIAQKLVHTFHGRPHWGKNGLYYFSEPVFALNNARSSFVSAMRKYDPDGIFRNKFGLRLMGLSSEKDVDPQMTHCALQDYCVCSTDKDCAPGQRCISFEETRVCEDLFPLLSEVTVLPKTVVRELLGNLSEILEK